ncbi:MAG TPA: hypothetical protein VG267_22455 [Terracidiphilus sp.]|nr:hypothetical protein [Terracidiphilus sp.]
MRRVPVSLFALLIVFPSLASGKGDPRQQLLNASHSTRINDVDMKPWHLKVGFHLNSRGAQPPEDGTIEEWWAGLTTWKLRIESASYTGTVIENSDGDFRTTGVGPIPLSIRGIEQEIVYPMPMGEDLSKMVPHMSHQKLEKVSLDCIQLSEPPIPVPSATFCFDQGSGALRAIVNANSSMLVRDRISQFAGHAPALSIKSVEGKTIIASGEVIDLSAMEPEDTIFKPSPDMKRVTDMHTLKVTSAR